MKGELQAEKETYVEDILLGGGKSIFGSEALGIAFFG
jgi:hypothetical protein